MKYLNIAILTVLSLALSTSAIAGNTVSVNVSCTILPLMELSVTGPKGGNIEFGMIQKDADKDVKVEAPEVVIRAKSNTGQPYKITHELIAPLADGKGSALPEDAMSVNAVSAGEGMAVTEQTVGTTSKTLYESDATGKSDTITARYNLNVTPEQTAGHYETKLLYTIVAL